MNEIIKKNGISFGIITGVVSVLITTLIYSIDLNLFTAWWVTVLNLLIYITISVILLLKTKKELNGIFSFKDAFTTYFISAVVGILIALIFNIILFNFIDPGIKDSIKELTIKYAVKMMQKYNTDASTINDAVKKLQENDQFSPIELIKGSAFSIVFSALFGLLLALIFKNKTSQE